MGLPARRHLRRPADFDRVLARGRRSADGLLSMTAILSGEPYTRFGLAVSGKVGGAVVRNRVRRRLREVLRGLSAVEGFDVVVSARPAVADASFERVKESVEGLSKRLGLLKETAHRQTGETGPGL